MMVSRGSLVENLFVDEFEVVQNEMEVEPDGKQASIGHTVEEEQLKRPQENLDNKDKESSPNHSKYHAHNQPREIIPVKKRQVSIEGSGSDEKKHEYYNIVHLSDSVNTDQPTKHNDGSSGNEVSTPGIDVESKFTSNSEESGHDSRREENDPTRDSEESDPTRENEERYSKRDSEESDPTRENEESDPARVHEERDPKRDSEESDPTRENEESDPIRMREERDPKRDSEESDPTREREETELTRGNSKGELTRDNKKTSIDKKSQWHAHVVQVHANDKTGNVVQNPQLCIQEHLLTESELKSDENSLKKSQETFTTIADEFNQIKVMDVMLAGKGSSDSDLFCIEAMTIETEIEPEEKQTSVSDTVEEEQVSTTTEINQSITKKEVAILRQTTTNENPDNFKESGHPSHNLSNIDLPLQERDDTTVSESTVRSAVHDSLEDVKTSKQENMKAEDKRKLQHHNEHQSISVKERKQSLQMEKDSSSENKLENYQNILEPKIKPVEMIVKGELVTVQTVLQTASAPHTKPGLKTDTDVHHGVEGCTSLTPSTSSKTTAVSHSRGFGDSLDAHDYEEIPDLTVGMDPSSLTRSKRHAHKQPKEWVTLKKRQVSIKRSKSDEKIHDYYNDIWLPDSVNTDQATSYKPHLSNIIWSHGTLPTKRKEASAKNLLSKEELCRQYRHRPPPSKDPALPPQISVCDQEDSLAVVINPTASDHEESNMPELDNISMVHEYEEIDLENFRFAVKGRDPSATSMLKSKEALRKMYKHRAPPRVPTETSTDSKENIPSENRQTKVTPSSEKLHEYSSPVEQKSQELIQAERVTLPSEEQPSLSDSTKTIQSVIIKEREEKDATIDVHGQLKEEPMTSMLKSPHSNAEGNSGHLLSVSDSDDDYMPLIPKRKKKKIICDYETLNFQQ